MKPDVGQYLQMQKAFYDKGPDSVEVIVGNYEYHENYPYETNLLFKYGDIRKPVLKNMSESTAIDVGCGEGRMIRRMSKWLSKVDGVDVSEKMVTAARARCPDSDVFVSNGSDCGAAKTSSYDFAYCTISLHHICVYSVRARIIADIVRVLKPEGCATLQFFFSRYYPYVRMTPPLTSTRDGFLTDLFVRDRLQADWFDDRTDAQGTNSMCDAAFGTKDIPAVVKDFKKWFREVDIWFGDISLGRPDPRDGQTPRTLPENHPNAHGEDNSWFSHMAFFHLAGPKK